MGRQLNRQQVIFALNAGHGSHFLGSTPQPGLTIQQMSFSSIWAFSTKEFG
jgi:hypothetical protein